MTDQQEAPVKKALFVRLVAQSGKGGALETFLRDGLAAVLEEPDTTSWYAVRFGDHDFAIFDTFPSDAGRLAHLAGKVGRALVARTPELLEGTPRIEHAEVLAFKLPDSSGQVRG
ncbi:quinol monooxygenase YgiN [Sphingomonas trueperi]|uniref:antibiotic biosynthesis monooxygenase n=1 Tax=Sphingomonas trueperi TaxID=53317 RepID=UPI0033942611